MAGHAFRFGKLILETACTETAHAAAGLAAGGMQNSTLTVFILRKPLHAVLCYDYAMNTFDELTRYGIVHLVPILQADSMEYMESLLKSLRPRTFLEIGTAIGRTAIDAASLLPELKVVTIEKDPEMHLGILFDCDHLELGQKAGCIDSGPANGGTNFQKRSGSEAFEQRFHVFHGISLKNGNEVHNSISCQLVKRIHGIIVT